MQILDTLRCNSCFKSPVSIAFFQCLDHNRDVASALTGTLGVRSLTRFPGTPFFSNFKKFINLCRFLDNCFYFYFFGLLRDYPKLRD